MKKIKLVLTIALFLVSFNVISQTKEVVYLRIQENVTTAGIASLDSYMSIIYPDQSTKYIELAKLGNKGQAAEENGKKIQAEISELINGGYEIISCSLGADYMSSTTVMVFTRQKEN